MKLIPSSVGANRKNLMVLGVLAAILVGVFIYDSSSSSPAATVPAVSANPNPSPAATNPAPVKQFPTAPAAPPRARNEATRVEDFRPSLKPKEGTDLTKIDPTIHFELLAKLEKEQMTGGTRSVFAFGQAPPPPAPPVDPIHPGGKNKVAYTGPQLPAPPPGPAAKPAPPPAPPIPLKFYGYSAKGGIKRAFFLDGDDIQVAGENELIKNRYKVIRIGVNSVVVEDTENKHQQTLPLVEEMAG